MTPPLDALAARPYDADAMCQPSTALRKILDAVPTSTRALAEEAGVSEKLLRMVRDGDRRLTPETRDALADALRRWTGRLEGAVEEIEAVDLEPRQGRTEDR